MDFRSYLLNSESKKPAKAYFASRALEKASQASSVFLSLRRFIASWNAWSAVRLA